MYDDAYTFFIIFTALSGIICICSSVKCIHAYRIYLLKQKELQRLQQITMERTNNAYHASNVNNINHVHIILPDSTLIEHGYVLRDDDPCNVSSEES
jgi:hypothetical protein